MKNSPFVCLFVFVALRPMSTAMVIAGRLALNSGRYDGFFLFYVII